MGGWNSFIIKIIHEIKIIYLYVYDLDQHQCSKLKIPFFNHCLKYEKTQKLFTDMRIPLRKPKYHKLFISFCKIKLLVPSYKIIFCGQLFVRFFVGYFRLTCDMFPHIHTWPLYMSVSDIDHLCLLNILAPNLRLRYVSSIIKTISNHLPETMWIAWDLRTKQVWRTTDGEKLTAH